MYYKIYHAYQFMPFQFVYCLTNERFRFLLYGNCKFFRHTIDDCSNFDFEFL